jgi:hypothetical protein
MLHAWLGILNTNKKPSQDYLLQGLSDSKSCGPVPTRRGNRRHFPCLFPKKTRAYRGFSLIEVVWAGPDASGEPASINLY